jgi:SagB-type dehydrogenase family enzyme
MAIDGRPNDDTSRAWTYHNATKHSEWSVRSSPHYLDWDNQPFPLKIYTTLEPIPLPRDAEQTGISALSAISAPEVSVDGERVPSLADLARVLYFSAGITKRKTYPGGEIYFRAASCTGALYQFELYLVCGDLPDLRAGVYHFGPGDFALRLLRAGDYRGVLVNATAAEESIGHAPATIVCAGTYWRNAWKYQARAYRHFGWDNGTILANMLAMTAALQLPSRVVLGFVDSEVNRLLDLDTDREVAFSLVSVGRTNSAIPESPREIPKLSYPTVPLSKSEVDYPELRAIHSGSSLESVEEVTKWRSAAVGAVREAQARQRAASSDDRPGRSQSAPTVTDTIEQVILRRGSTRQFGRVPITRDQLLTILQNSTRGIWPGIPLLNDLYLIINAVEGLAPGAYFYRRDTNTLESLKSGDFRGEARHLGLQQDLPGDAAADVFFLADLDSILERFGNRGYRAVQLEAGILGGKIYLAAYAQRLGATGLTFYDDDVTDFFSPHAKGKSAIFLMAFGTARARITSRS